MKYQLINKLPVSRESPFQDVKLYCLDMNSELKEIMAHKLILTKGSTLFEKIILTKDIGVLFMDIPYDVLNLAVDVIYGNEVRTLNQKKLSS